MADYFITYFGQLQWGLNFLFTNALICICVSYLFNDLKFTGWKNILIHLADLLVTYGVHLLLESIINWMGIPPYMGIISWPIVILGHAFLMNKMDIMDRLMKAMTFTCLTLLIYQISGEAGMLMNIWNEDFIIVFVFSIVSVYMIKRFTVEDYQSFSVICFVSEVLVMLVVFAILILGIAMGQSNIPELYQLFVHIGLYVISGVVCVLYFKIGEEEKKVTQSNALAFKSNNDYEMVKLTTDNMEALRKMRHDMKAQYQYMKVLLEKKDYEALNQFFTDMQEESFVPLNFVNCGNNAVSGVMNVEINKAKEKGIQIKHLLLVPQKLDISDFDLCRFLSNSIDNAIEAVEADQTKDAIIDVKIIFRDPMLMIYVENPVSDRLSAEERLNITTTKADKNLHSYGKKIMAEICKKYDGEISRKIEKNQFLFSAMLRLKQGE